MNNILQFTSFLLIFSLLTLNQEHRGNTDPVQGFFDIGTIQSVIIQKNSAIIAEEYTGNMHRNRTTNIKSASKSVLSLLIGIAIEEGYMSGVEQTIDQFFPDYFEANPDPIKESITIKNLLTMQTGLETTSFRNYGRWVISDNWMEFALNQPVVESPGGEMIYSTGTSHLLSVILARATGMSAQQFANRYLFEPMDISVGGWDRDPQGYFMGGNNMALSPMALLKIGNMVLNSGRFNDNQIVPESWIRESLEIYTRSNFNPYNFGYMWWHKNLNGTDVIFAWGNGGQYIMIISELKSVISITSDLQRNSGSRRYQREIFRHVEQHVIPFLVKADA